MTIPLRIGCQKVLISKKKKNCGHLTKYPLGCTAVDERGEMINIVLMSVL